MTTALPSSFIAKKQRILQQLETPDAEYDDLSPKGSVDEGIRDLIAEINEREGFVTTSSCAGRISVFLEGKKSVDAKELEIDAKAEKEAGRATIAKIGGKGGGGRWLFVSHDPIPWQDVKNLTEIMGMRPCSHEENYMSSDARRHVHFKFEPMILHILTASLSHAQTILSAALQAGFRESGAINLLPSATEAEATPIVAVRSMGLSLESLIGFQASVDDDLPVCTVSEVELQTLMQISDERFRENERRIARFRETFLGLAKDGTGVSSKKRNEDGGEWEDAELRRARKREEGLRRAMLFEGAGKGSFTR